MANWGAAIGGVLGGVAGSFVGMPVQGAMLGASIGGSLNSASQAERVAQVEVQGQRETNIAQQVASREQMEFQERMSSTAHQREVEDLRKAGLNPILSAKYGGASTPSGAQPIYTNPYRSYAENVTGGTAKLASAQLSAAQQVSSYTQAELNRAQAKAAEAAAVTSTSQAAKNAAETAAIMQSVRERKPMADFRAGPWGAFLGKLQMWMESLTPIGAVVSGAKNAAIAAGAWKYATQK